MSEQDNPMLKSRAVERMVPEGAVYECAQCGEKMRFVTAASMKKLGTVASTTVVVCNVYESKVWQGIEQYHPDCYEEANNPYGDVLPNPPVDVTPPGERSFSRKTVPHNRARNS